MSTRDLKYYGISEKERIQRSILKKQRWVNSNYDSEGIRQRIASIIRLDQRLIEIDLISILREKREKEKP